MNATDKLIDMRKSQIPKMQKIQISEMRGLLTSYGISPSNLPFSPSLFSPSPPLQTANNNTWRAPSALSTLLTLGIDIPFG